MIQMLVCFSTSSLGILTFHRTSDTNVLHILSASKYQNPSCETLGGIPRRDPPSCEAPRQPTMYLNFTEK